MKFWIFLLIEAAEKSPGDVGALEGEETAALLERILRLAFERTQAMHGRRD